MSETTPPEGRVSYRSEDGVAIITLETLPQTQRHDTRMCDELLAALERPR